MKIKVKFYLILYFIKMSNDIEPDSNSWEVGDLLSGMNFWVSNSNKNLVTHTGDPAYWYDWKELVEEEVSKDKTILNENNGLTLEQGLVAIQYFLEHKYWLRDHDMLLKDAYADLMQEYNNSKDNLESSHLWQEWLKAVSEGKKFDKVFVEPKPNVAD